MKEVRLECPKCGQPVETDEATARRGIACPVCGRNLTGPQFKGPETGETELKSRRGTIRRRAADFVLWGIILFILSFFIAFGSMCTAITGDGCEAGFITSGVLTGCSLWLYLIGQIIHIRANTEK
jgi:hypothetical protein